MRVVFTVVSLAVAVQAVKLETENVFDEDSFLAQESSLDSMFDMISASQLSLSDLDWSDLSFEEKTADDRFWDGINMAFSAMQDKISDSAS